MEMKKVKLGEIADFANGLNFDKSAYKSGAKIIGVSDFQNYTTPNIESLNEVSEDVIKETAKLLKDDIIFVRSNGNKDLVGRCMIIPESKINLYFSGFCIRCRFKNKFLYNPIYYLYFFKSPLFRKILSNNSVGANIQNLSQTRLSRLEVPVPPFSIQEKIGEILSAYDDMINNCKRQIALLEEAAQRLFKEWFVDLRFPGHEDTPIGENGLPEGWTYQRLGSVCQYQRGVSYTSSELSSGHLFINLKNIAPYGGYNLGAEKLYNGSFKDVHVVETDDIIMGITDMTADRRCVGHVALIPKIDGIKIISPDLIKLTPLIGHYFIYCQLRFGNVSRTISLSANGTNVLHLKPENAMLTKVLVPSKQVIRLFEDFCKNYFDAINEILNIRNETLKAKELILPRLISGQIEINV